MISSKVLAGLIVVGVLVFLFFNGPAQGFILGMVVSENNVFQGENINFHVSVENENGENLEIDSISLKLTGPEKINCKFLPSGKIIQDCFGIKIEKVSENCNSYGYGYSGTCLLNFSVTLETGKIKPGVYDTFLNIESGNNIDEITGEPIIINKRIDGVCSIRAKKGEFSVNEKTFTNNRINFYIPFKNANAGEGYLTGQKSRERFVYRFVINKILENNERITRVELSGKLRIGTKEEISENAVLRFDRINNKISLAGNNINARDLEIYFRKEC